MPNFRQTSNCMKLGINYLHDCTISTNKKQVMLSNSSNRQSINQFYLTKGTNATYNIKQLKTTITIKNTILKSVNSSMQKTLYKI